MRQKHKQSCGISVIEVITVIAIISVSFFAVSQLAAGYVFYSQRNHQFYAALNVAKEGMEAVRDLRNASWSDNIASLSVAAPYYLSSAGGTWTLSSTNSALIDGKYKRTIFLATVYRDANDDIAAAGVADPNMRKVTASVLWNNGRATQSISLETYLADYLKN